MMYVFFPRVFDLPKPLRASGLLVRICSICYWPGVYAETQLLALHFIEGKKAYLNSSPTQNVIRFNDQASSADVCCSHTL